MPSTYGLGSRDAITRALLEVQNPPPPTPITPGMTDPAMPAPPQPLVTAGQPGGQPPGALGGGAAGLPPSGMAPQPPGQLGGVPNMQQMLGQQPLLPQPSGLPRYG